MELHRLRDHDRSDEPCDTLRRPLRDLRISVTDRCNFRCPYCMPSDAFGEGHVFLPKPEILRFEEIERLARIFVGLGARKLRLTGGEPLLRAELPALVRRLAGIEGADDLALTSNGFLLAARAEALAAAGLTRVTVSLDSLEPEVFRHMSGSPHDPGRVLAAIDAAARAGLGPIKVNCVVQRGVNDGGVLELARHFRGTGHVVRFIEFMDVGTRNRWDFSQVLPTDELLGRIDSEFPLEPVEPDYLGEVARRWRYRDGAGEIGVIASVSRPFCGHCTRARISADGHLLTCLFASQGVDLKKPMREGASDADLRALLTAHWRQRSDRYSEERSDTTTADAGRRGRVEMYRIGG